MVAHARLLQSVRGVLIVFAVVLHVHFGYKVALDPGCHGHRHPGTTVVAFAMHLPQASPLPAPGLIAGVGGAAGPSRLAGGLADLLLLIYWGGSCSV